VADRRRWTRFALLALLVAAVVTVLLSPVERWLIELADWIRDAGVTGMLVFVAAYVVGALVFAPAFVLTLLAGFAYGPLHGTLLVWPTATLAAALAFLMGRFVARDWVSRRAKKHPRFGALDQAIGREGWKLVVLMRLSPVFPYNLLNYALGLTQIPFWHYLLATGAGMLPGTVMYVYLGSLITSASRLSEGAPEGGKASSVLYWTGLVITVGIALWVTRLARRAVKGKLDGAVDV
jgi:uncharacterized membrane protein YdjX (TVP38/TMEM64 family)